MSDRKIPEYKTEMSVLKTRIRWLDDELGRLGYYEGDKPYAFSLHIDEDKLKAAVSNVETAYDLIMAMTDAIADEKEAA